MAIQEFSKEDLKMAIQQKISKGDLIYAQNRLKELVLDCIRDPENFRVFEKYESKADKGFEIFVRLLASEMNELITGRADKFELTEAKTDCFRMMLIYIIVRGI